MKTKLDKLIVSTDPYVTLDKVAAKVDAALNSFHPKTGFIQNRDDFEALLPEFYCHVENFIIKFKTPRNPHPVFDLSRCEKMLIKEYGENGVNIAFDMARTGVSGGLHAVFKAVAHQMVEEYAGNEIRLKISEFWDSLTLEEKMAATEEYIDKYGHLIPSELLEQGAARLRVFFWKTLEEHPRIVRRLRNAR